MNDIRDVVDIDGALWRMILVLCVIALHVLAYMAASDFTYWAISRVVNWKTRRNERKRVRRTGGKG